MTAAIETVKKTQAAPGQIKSILRKTAASTGADFNFLLKVAQRESSLRADVKASTSSASGLFQFIEQTWLEAVKKHGSKVGLAKEASQIVRTASGYAVSSSEQRSAILDKRFDPQIAAEVAARTFHDTAQTLSSKLGRAVSNGELYLAHFLGTAGAARMIQADGAARAADIAPAAARANTPLFYQNGAALSVDDFRNRVTAAFADQSVSEASAPSARRFASRAGIQDYAPPLASPINAHQANTLPMSVFREILELEAVRQFSADSQEANEKTRDER